MLTTVLLATLLNQTPAPAADFSDLLAHHPKLNLAEPSIDFKYVRAVFVPAGDFKAKLTFEANGKLLNEVPMISNVRVGTQALLTFKTATYEKLGTENGPRKITLFINDKPAGQLNFTLTKSQSDDPYDPKVSWLISKSPWQTHGYFTHAINTTNQKRVNFFFYMETSEIGPNKTYDIEIVMRRGTVILAKSFRPHKVNFTALYPYESPLYKTEKEPLMVNDLAKISGPFVLEIKMGSKVIRSYRGEIAGGELKAHKNSSMSHELPTTFLTERHIGTGNVGLSDRRMTWITTE